MQDADPAADGAHLSQGPGCRDRWGQVTAGSPLTDRPPLRSRATEAQMQTQGTSEWAWSTQATPTKVRPSGRDPLSHSHTHTRSGPPTLRHTRAHAQLSSRKMCRRWAPPAAQNRHPACLPPPEPSVGRSRWPRCGPSRMLRPFLHTRDWEGGELPARVAAAAPSAQRKH